jgi:cytidylate kinase
MDKNSRAIVIAVDGPAGSGKGVISKGIAQHMGYAHLDTGKLYRLTAYYLLESGRDIEDVEQILELIKQMKEQDTYNQPIEDYKLRVNSDIASKIASYQEVRLALNDMKRDFAQGRKGVVIDGRDIGTVIFPDAECKLFITADIEIRAKRRFKQLQMQYKNIIYNDVVKELRERDARDSSRAAAPLKIAQDAVVIDTTLLDENQAVEKAIEIIHTALANINH